MPYVGSYYNQSSFLGCGYVEKSRKCLRMFSFTYPKVRIKTDLKASQTRKHSDKNKTTEKNYVPEIKVTPERLASLFPQTLTWYFTQ